MNTTEIFLIAMTIIFSLPWLVWRLGRTDYFAPLVVVQILAGIVLGPGLLGAALPDYHRFVFNPAVVQALNGVAWWAVMLFVCIAGIELDLRQAWAKRRESGITAGLALGVPMLAGARGGPLALVWLALCALGADWSGLLFMVGAFLAGAVLDAHWFDQDRMDLLRHHVLLVLMPVFFLSTGLRTQWGVGGAAVFGAAALLLVASVAGKLAGLRLAGRVLGWAPGEASLIGWLLQTKALIMIIFANVLLDKQVISSDAFTALLLMAVASTMLTIPMVTPMLARQPALRQRG